STNPSVSFHLIVSMQYHLTRRARSREVRLLGGRVPFAFSRVAFRVRWRSLTPHQDPHHKVKRSTSAPASGTGSHKPVLSLGDEDLKPDTFSFHTGLVDGDTGDREDLPGEKEPEP